jgi:hypothetical protein
MRYRRSPERLLIVPLTEDLWPPVFPAASDHQIDHDGYKEQDDRRRYAGAGAVEFQRFSTAGNKKISGRKADDGAKHKPEQPKQEYPEAAPDK